MIIDNVFRVLEVKLALIVLLIKLIKLLFEACYFLFPLLFNQQLIIFLLEFGDHLVNLDLILLQSVVKALHIIHLLLGIHLHLIYLFFLELLIRVQSDYVFRYLVNLLFEALALNILII